MARYALSKYFARGAGHVVRLHGAEVLLFDWHGRRDGHAYIDKDDKGRATYRRGGVVYPSFAALLRGVEQEHNG